MKIKLLISFFILSFVIISCKDDDDGGGDNFDHEGQAILDDATIREFLETHYYIPAPADNDSFGVIDTILNGETSLMSQVITQEVEFNDINYKQYVLKNTPEGINKTPTKIDRVLVKYQGHTIKNNTNQFDERITYTWLSLASTITGWSYGFTNFKSGTNISILDNPLEFENTGSGIIFIPSGLAYFNIGTSNISPNTPIYFHVELAEVEFDDNDSDSIFSKYEDLNNDDDVINDDTDGDSIPNFADIDDDNDGLLTLFESPDNNEDGNPNDALDTDGDGIPNFLDDDDDGDGIKTKNEDADPNGDGNPDDAEDSDGDNIPDYLDAN